MKWQVATEPTQLEIKSNVENVNTNVTSVKNDVATVKTNVTTINTNVNTINTNVGTPTSSASNGTSANVQVHAKLNWLTKQLSAVTNKVAGKEAMRVAGTSASSHFEQATSQNGMIIPYTYSTGLSPYLNVTGSGRLLYILNSTYNYSVYIYIDGKQFTLNADGWIDVPFSSSLRIEHGGTGSSSYAPRLIYYSVYS